MAVVALTDKAASAAKAAPGKRLELWDSKVSGLCLRVTAKGQKTWVIRYRTLDDRQPRLNLGDYTERQGVRWAREAAEDVRQIVRRGGDPAGERRKKKEEARAQPIRTFDDLADAYLQACKMGHWTPKGVRKRTRTLTDETGILQRHLRPTLGKLALQEVTRVVVRKALRAMLDRGICAQTNRAHAVLRQVFAYAIAEYEGRLVSVNPGTGFAPLAQESPRSRVLTDAELKTLWTALDAPDKLYRPAKEEGGKPERVYIGPAMVAAIRLTMLCLQRRGEVAGMLREEIDLEDRSVWIIPADRAKNHRPHAVPLTPLAVEIIRTALKLVKVPKGEETPGAVFPGARDKRRPITAGALSHAFRSLCLATGIEGATPHDLRRTGASNLASDRLGFTPFVVSKVLGHSSDTGGGSAVTAAHYSVYTYATEKRRALAAWEELLLDIIAERKRPSNVSILRHGTA